MLAALDTKASMSFGGKLTVWGLVLDTLFRLAICLARLHLFQLSNGEMVR